METRYVSVGEEVGIVWTGARRKRTTQSTHKYAKFDTFRLNSYYPARYTFSGTSNIIAFFPSKSMPQVSV